MGFNRSETRRSLVRTLGLAAAGVGIGSTTASAALPHSLVVESADGSAVEYSIEVSGSVETMARPAGDSASGATASGRTWWRDGYRYSGDVVGFEYDGPAVVRVDGRRVDPDAVGASTLTVSAAETGRHAAYEFGVTGSVETRGNGDNADGARAWGEVWGWKDSYAYTGAVTDFSLDGDANVFVDGAEVDPSTLETSTIVIEGAEDADTGCRYEFAVSGSVEEKGSGDTAVGDRAWGTVWGWRDAYEYSGTVESFSMDGPATVSIDGETVDPATLGDGGGGGGDGGSGDDGSGSRPFDERVEREIHARVNEIRSNRGLSELQWGSGLARVADGHSADMAENDYFSHTSPSGESPGDRYEEAGLSCRGWGENIAYNSGSDVGAEAAADRTVEQWMNSAGHRRNILRESFTSEGIGVVVSGDQLYATQNFGTDCS